MRLWAVGIGSLLWNGFGVFDFVMTNIRDPAYLRNVPVETMTYIDTMPAWSIVAWAVGTWSAALGSVLLLARSRFAVTGFAASLFGLAAGMLHRQASAEANPMGTDGDAVMNLAIWFVAILLLILARRWRRMGVLG